MHFLALVAFALAVCAGGRYVPPTHNADDRSVLPLTFPDGTRVEIAYPPELAIAELGVIPSGSATLHGRRREVGRDFLVRHEPHEGFPIDGLAYSFGRWALLVYDYGAGDPAAMTAAERRAFIRSLAGRETADGFLVLEARPPLRLAAADEHAGPALEFGSPGLPPWLRLALVDCGPNHESTSPRFVSWCLSDSVVAHAEGDRRFLAAVTEGLALR